MRSAQLDFADPQFPVSLVDAPDPLLPGPGWARVSVTYGGICGSDLHIVRPDGTGSAVTLPFVRGPMQMGHEIGGVVVDAGPDCAVPLGTRVAVDPTIACAAREGAPCPRCREGSWSACWNLDTGSGMGLGFTSGLGAGWSEMLVAHSSQLHPVPPGVDDRAVPLTEPLSIALHGLLRRQPADGAPVLVIGAGIIGLAALVASRALAPSSEVTVLAKHDHQAAAAVSLGAHRVVRLAEDGSHLTEMADATGGRVTGRGSGATIRGGFPVVVEAVGSGPSFGLALRVAATRGVVHLMGAVGRVETDVTALWFHELDVVGTFCHAFDTHDGEHAHSFDRALTLLARGAYPPDVIVTHVFALADLREAIETALARDRGAIKVLLRP